MSTWGLADLLGVHEHEIDLAELPDQPVRVVYELARRLDSHPGDLIFGAEDLFARRRTRPQDNPAGAELGDQLTAATALALADRPMIVDELADALGWEHERTVDALCDLRDHPHPHSPLSLRRIAPEYYTRWPHAWTCCPPSR